MIQLSNAMSIYEIASRLQYHISGRKIAVIVCLTQTGANLVLYGECNLGRVSVEARKIWRL